MTRRGRTSLNTYLNNKKNRQGIEAIAYWVVEDTFDRVPVPTGNDYTTRTHNHLHVLVIFLTKLTEAQQIDFLEGMREAWINAIRKAGGYTSRERAMYCVRIDTGRESSSRISEYITKTISSAHSDAEKAKSGKLKLELTHHFNKRGQGRSIIELLRDIKRRGWECDVKAYRFLIRANKGKPRSYGNRAWNRYLERAKLLAEDEDDQSEPEIALIDPEVGLTRFDGEHGEVRTLEEFIGGWKAGEVDVKVSFTKVMLGHIVRSGAFFHLLELVSKASVGVHLELFQEFKEYCRSNPFWGDKNLKRTPVRLQLDEQMSRWKKQIYV
jgi:hypothetical protein